MAEFSSYIKSISVFALLMVFTEIFMIEGFYRKYTSFILGIILSVMAISPLIGLLKGNEAESFIENIEESILYESENVSFSDENIILKSIFTENAVSYIKNDLKSIGFKYEDVSVEVYENNGEYIIKKIEVTSSEEDTEKAESILKEKYMAEETVFSAY